MRQFGGRGAEQYSITAVRLRYPIPEFALLSSLRTGTNIGTHLGKSYCISSLSTRHLLMLLTKRFRRLFKEGFWIALGQVLTVAGSLIGVRLLTDLLTPNAYGELTLGMTIATLVNQIILGPLSGGITRFYAPALECGDMAEYLSAAKRLALYATGIVFLIILFSIIGLTVARQTQWLAITVSALVFAIFSGYCANLSGIQTAARQRTIVAIHQGLEPLLRLLIAVGLLLWLGTTSTIAMISYAIAALLMFGSQVFFFRKTIISNTFNTINRNWPSKIWQFSWPIGIFGIFTWLQLVSDRWALQVFSSTRDVANYAVLYQLGYYPISLLTGMAMQFLVPILYQRAGDANDSRRNADVNRLSWQLVWLSLGLTLVASLLVILLHPLLFRILVAKEYAAVSYLLPWMIAAGGIFASGQTLASNLLAQMKTREMITAKIVTALVGVILNFVGAYWYGLIGIIYAGVLFSILYFLWMVMLVTNGSKKCFC